MPPDPHLPTVDHLRIGFAGGWAPLAYQLRPGGDDLLVCLHGWGCAKESFRSAFTTPALRGWSVCAFDFPGHGGSPPIPTTVDTIQAYADLTVRLLRQLAPDHDRVVLLGHSLGGAVGLVASQELPGLGGFLSVEGNLVAQDCGMISRRVAAAPEEEFLAEGSRRLHATLAGADRADLRAWAGWYAQAEPRMLHRAARSLVEWSDSGKLLSLLTGLDRAAYLYGRDSGDLSYLWPALTGVVPTYPIPAARHFPMLDNPAEFWPTVARVLRAWSRPRTPAPV